MCFLRVEKFLCGHKFLYRTWCQNGNEYVCDYGQRTVVFQAVRYPETCHLCEERALYEQENGVDDFKDDLKIRDTDHYEDEIEMEGA